MMRNPDQMREIIEFTDRYFALNRKTPSCREIAANTTLKRSSVHNYLVAMNEMGMIEYNGKDIMTPNVRAMRQDARRIGIVGSVTRGLPKDATEEPDEYLNLPNSMAGDGEIYILYASGNSMIGAGIEDGDMVLVRRQETARDGDIVLAYVEGEGNTLKRLRHEGKKILLHPENPEMTDIPVENPKIQGVVLWVFKKVGNEDANG